MRYHLRTLSAPDGLSLFKQIVRKSFLTGYLINCVLCILESFFLTLLPLPVQQTYHGRDLEAVREICT